MKDFMRTQRIGKRIHTQARSWRQLELPARLHLPLIQKRIARRIGIDVHLQQAIAAGCRPKVSGRQQADAAAEIMRAIDTARL